MLVWLALLFDIAHTYLIVLLYQVHIKILLNGNI